MADSPTSALSTPKTLAEAKSVIASLRTKLGESPPAGGKSIPKDPGNPYPNPHPGEPINPKNAVTLDLSAMAPATLERFLSERSSAEVKLLLSRETAKGARQDEHVVWELYKELKRRA